MFLFFLIEQNSNKQTDDDRVNQSHHQEASFPVIFYLSCVCLALKDSKQLTPIRGHLETKLYGSIQSTLLLNLYILTNIFYSRNYSYKLSICVYDAQIVIRM